jgi:tetratricopeptide (TPR) repeat protein
VLGRELAGRHGLVRAERSPGAGDGRLATYRFRHSAFQRHLYDDLDEGERGRLHRDVGEALEGLYEGRTAEVATSLAWHFREGHDDARAIHYMHEAAREAVRLAANEVAVAHLGDALSLVGQLPESPDRAHKQSALLTDRIAALSSARGYGSPELGEALAEARRLCEETGEGRRLFEIAIFQSACAHARGELRAAGGFAEEALALAREGDDARARGMAHGQYAYTLLFLGEFGKACEQYERSFDAFGGLDTEGTVWVMGQELVLSFLAQSAWALWFLGDLEESSRRAEMALERAERLGHDFMRAYTWMYLAIRSTWIGDVDEAERRTEDVLRLSRDKGFAFPEMVSSFHSGWVMSRRGRADEGAGCIRRSIEAFEGIGVRGEGAHQRAMLADALARAGRTDEALAAVGDALALARESGEGTGLAEAQRLKGVLLLERGEPGEAEESLREAVTVAARQEALSLELRAVIPLARLWSEQNRKEEARRLLAGVCDRFTEGLDSAELNEARQLLRELPG